MNVHLKIIKCFFCSDFFIFDDCLSAVDATKEQKILHHLRLESKGKSSIIISHRINSLKETDNIIVLEKGEIIEKGTHQQLLEKKGFYFSMYKSQSNTTKNSI